MAYVEHSGHETVNPDLYLPPEVRKDDRETAGDPPAEPTGGGGAKDRGAKGSGGAKRTPESPSAPFQAQGATGVSSYSWLPSLGLDGAFMLVMLTRIQSLNDDLNAQIGKIMKRNELKKLYNGELDKLNVMLKAAKEAAGSKKKDGEAVEFTIPADQVAEGAYLEGEDEQGRPTLRSTGRAEDKVGEVVSVTTEGAKMKGSVAEIESAIERLRSRMDTLNADSELDTLRLHDLQNKTQVAFDLVSKILEKRHQTRMNISQSMGR